MKNTHSLRSWFCHRWTVILVTPIIAVSFSKLALQSSPDLFSLLLCPWVPCCFPGPSKFSLWDPHLPIFNFLSIFHTQPTLNVQYPLFSQHPTRQEMMTFTHLISLKSMQENRICKELGIVVSHLYCSTYQHSNILLICLSVYPVN